MGDAGRGLSFQKTVVRARAFLHSSTSIPTMGLYHAATGRPPARLPAGRPSHRRQSADAGSLGEGELEVVVGAIGIADANVPEGVDIQRRVGPNISDCIDHFNDPTCEDGRNKRALGPGVRVRVPITGVRQERDAEFVLVRAVGQRSDTRLLLLVSAYSRAR